MLTALSRASVAGRCLRSRSDDSRGLSPKEQVCIATYPCTQILSCGCHPSHGDSSAQWAPVMPSSSSIIASSGYSNLVEANPVSMEVPEEGIMPVIRSSECRSSSLSKDKNSKTQSSNSHFFIAAVIWLPFWCWNCLGVTL
ncbi:expressed unknown protein [Seminavis robusta]|uniref:Uncharacterized protein n=1 Tax=Seminavis robusta TaxID=568900 RepID=A0A9N8ETC6_9STRA|nr:expressed unknown protein [Seminavis robusta]|eukprot:Sro1907_g304701.1  (141) ;mRNA; f:17979-18401